MPFMDQRGLEVAYDVVGPSDGQPWVITPGGRYGRDYPGIREMAEALARRGRRVLVHDRLNCGESAVCFEGESESEMQADSLALLIEHLGLGPSVLVGGTGGGRVSLLTAARHPHLASGVAVWWITGGYQMMNLAMTFNAPSLSVVSSGRMEAVVDLETWSEVVTRNPRNRERFLALDAMEFKSVMERWMHAYCGCGDPIVPGLTDEQARSLAVPILVFRSDASDRYHTREVSEQAAARLPNAELIDPAWGDDEWASRLEERNTAGGSFFSSWDQLVPQLVDWADRRIVAVA